MNTRKMYEAVFNKLMSLGREGTYRECVFAVDTGMVAINPESTVNPAEVILNETSARFGPARDKTTYRRDRDQWSWRMVVKFNGGTVSASEFEDFLNETPPLIPANKDEDTRQARLLLLSATYDHPPYQEPSRGTHITFTFEVELSPQ